MVISLEYLEQNAITLADVASRESTPKADNLRKQGFPDHISRAFLHTADADMLLDPQRSHASVVLTRVPGTAATGLIADGYALKSFFVHAKSCDWGPMAGFVAFLPALNKKGPAGIKSNLKSHLETIKWFQDFAAEQVKVLRAKTKTTGKLYTHDSKQEIPSSPFIPLVLTKQAFGRLQPLNNKDYYFDQGSCLKFSSNSYVGIARNKDKSVFMEYLLLPDEHDSLWRVYHRNVYVNEDPDKPNNWAAYLKEEAGHIKFCKNEENALVIPQGMESLTANEDAEKFLRLNRSIEGSSATLMAGPLVKFYPVLATQNPYPTYFEKKDEHKNAITGDYDLFAVWPMWRAYRLEDQIRKSEMERERENLPPPQASWGSLFKPMPGKNLSLELTFSAGVYIEVIPNEAEIKSLEDPKLGNINNAVQLAAQLLNALVYGELNKPANPTNVAFHNDEGGRPGVIDFECPIAAFLPKGIWLPTKATGKETTTTQKAYGLVINNAVDFMDLILLLRGQARISIASGWLAHLLILVDNENITIGDPQTRAEKKSDLQKYLENRRRERELLQEEKLNGLRDQVWSLLTGCPPDVVHEDKQVKAVMRRATQVFAEQLYSKKDIDTRLREILSIAPAP
jgi:hypothetical protein